MSHDDWQSVNPGMGTCFHQALHRWADLRTTGDIWKIAIGIVGPNHHDPVRHIHCWLQRGRETMSAVTGEIVIQQRFYDFVGVEPGSVRLVNPRSIMRARKGYIDRDTITALLNESGHKWKANERGGILPK